MAGAIRTETVSAAQMHDLLKVVVGFPPGGTADMVSRWIAAQLRGSYAKSTVVENRSGAGGQIAVQAVKTMPPDGRALLVTPASMLVIYPHLYRSLPYAPLEDLTPVSLSCTFEFGLAVGPLVPGHVQDVEAFVAWANDHPTLANFGSPASGSIPHFIGELLAQAGGVDMQHVAYRGTHPATMALLGGQIAAVSGPVGDFLQYLPEGTLRLLATSGAARSRYTPDTPTFTEQGYPELVFEEWFGVFGPAGMAAYTVDALNAAVREALQAREVKESLATLAVTAVSSSPQELRASLEQGLERWSSIVERVGSEAA